MGQGSAALLAEVRSRHTEEEIERAGDWIARTFEKFVETENVNGKTRQRLYWMRVVVTPDEIEKGMFREDQEGWGHFQHQLTNVIALFYIDIILDDSIPDEDKVLAIVKYDEEAGHGYGPYFKSYPDPPLWYVLSREEIDRRNEHYRVINERKAELAEIIMNPLTSEKAKAEARKELGIP